MKNLLFVLISSFVTLSMAGQSGTNERGWGNSNASLVIGGRIAFDDGWIYYSNPYDSLKLYKIKPDCSGKIKLNDDIPVFINVVKTSLFYINENRKSGSGLYKTQLNGRPRWNIDDGSFAYLRVNNSGWAFFLQDMYAFQLPTHMVTRSKERIFEEKDITRMVVDDNFIYYTKWWENLMVNGKFGGLYIYYRRDKKKEQLKNPNYIINSLITNDVDRWIIYEQEGGYTASSRDGGKQYASGIFRRTKDMEKSQDVLGKEYIRNWYMVGEWVYFYREIRSGVKNLYRMKPDGTLEQRITDKVGDVYEAGDYIVVWSDKQAWIMLKDGRFVKELK